MASELSNQIKRIGTLLKKGAQDQIVDYSSRFKSIEDLYERLLSSLIISNFPTDEAYETALQFFGSPKVKFAAVDGTEYHHRLFDLVIFFGGAYAATGEIEFSEGKPPSVDYGERFVKEGRGVSSCVPVYINQVAEIDQNLMQPNQPRQTTSTRPPTEQTLVDNSTISSWIMTFSEFYLAYKLAADTSENFRIILLDRSLSTMHASLTYDTSRRHLWQSTGILFGFKIDGKITDINDLAYGRHRFYNPALQLPPARGDYLRYAIIYLLQATGPLTAEEIFAKLGADNRDRQARILKYLDKSVKERYLEQSNDTFSLNPRYQDVWARLRKLVITVGERLFGGQEENPMHMKKEDKKRWLTTQDLAFLSLFTLYMLIEECWKRRILLIGITKDTAARDFLNHLIPVALSNSIWECETDLLGTPNTDRMLLQAASMSNSDKVAVPWSLIEYDSAFQLIIPSLGRKRSYVSGAVRNKISPEKLFVKTYIQLSQARGDRQLRSNVLFIDRLCHPDFDNRGGTSVRFLHEYGSAVEPVEPILYTSNQTRNPLQSLVMHTLKAMTSPSIPEAFGHNRPLYIADKVAKWHWQEAKKVIDSTGEWIANNRDLRRFVFYMTTFRERRADVEAARRAAS